MRMLLAHERRLVIVPLAWLIAMMPLITACMGSSSQDIAKTSTPASSGATTEFTLKTVTDDKGLAFVGVGGAIDGIRNPTLDAQPNTPVKVNLVNGDGVQHTVTFPDFNATTDPVNKINDKTSITFTPSKAGSLQYYCTIPGHKAAGMVGNLNVGSGALVSTADDIARHPDDIPPAVGARDPQAIRIDMNVVEKEGQLDDGTTYTYWTFDGTVPGPFVRVREGDTVELHLKNPADAKMAHSIDLHAVNGPGGGATVMQVAPGEEKMFTFKALNPGIYVYHCATPSVAHHIAQGMYGMILVEPAGGLPPVDHEYYVMQGDMYTSQPYGSKGHLDFNNAEMMAEQPTYIVFNGAVGSLTTKHPLTAKVGETVRIFFGDGGPNLTSSFHVIGEIFDRLYNQGSITSPPLTNVQTTTVAPGGATMVEFTVQVPGRYLLVDHALSRIEEGALGFLQVTGDANPGVFNAPPAPTGSGGH